MMISAIFKKTWVILVVTYSAMIASFLIGAYAIVFPTPIATALRFISPFRRFDSVVYGNLDLSTVVFYLALAALFIFVVLKRYSVPTAVGKRRAIALKCIVMAAAMLVISIASALLPVSLRWVDVTHNKLYSTDKTTDSLIDSLNEEITLYLLDSDSSEEKLISYIEKYCARSPKLTLKKVDTTADTSFREKYGFSENANLRFCIVVESSKRYTVIGAVVRS